MSADREAAEIQANSVRPGLVGDYAQHVARADAEFKRVMSVNLSPDDSLHQRSFPSGNARDAYGRHHRIRGFA